MGRAERERDRQELSEAEIANNGHNAQVYQRLIELHRDAIN